MVASARAFGRDLTYGEGTKFYPNGQTQEFSKVYTTKETLSGALGGAANVMGTLFSGASQVF